MTSLAERFAAQAEALVGTPFRLGGRDPATGLDCIGIAACALGRAGGEVHSPTGYALRNIDIDRKQVTYLMETALFKGKGRKKVSPLLYRAFDPEVFNRQVRTNRR